MIKKELIKEITERLVKTYKPFEIYLFGSYAWGQPDEESDLDFLIVVEKSEQERFERAVKGHHALFGLLVSKDIIVYTKEEFERSSKDVTSFSHRIKKKGKRVYAARGLPHLCVCDATACSAGLAVWSVVPLRENYGGLQRIRSFRQTIRFSSKIYSGRAA